MFTAKVCLVLLIGHAWVRADAQTDSPNAPNNPSVWFNAIYPYPTKPDKWSKECDTPADCPRCQGDLIVICMSGYCGCKNRYNFG